MVKIKPQSVSRNPDRADAGRDHLRLESLDKIHRLRGQLRKGVLGMVLFSAISAVSMLNVHLFPPLTESVRRFLGQSPPVTLISIALVVYVFSALTLILARMNKESNTYRGWSHLGYLTAFYGFYYYAGELGDNFWAVFAGGLTILGLENYRVWTYCSEAIRREEEVLANLEG